MLALETVVKIRIDHLRNKVPIKAIARKREVARNTVRKAVREGAEAFGSAGKRQPKPKLGPWIGELERMLAESAKLPKRERPTLTRIHEDLAALGCAAGYDSVRRHAAAWRGRRAWRRVPDRPVAAARERRRRSRGPARLRDRAGDRPAALAEAGSRGRHGRPADPGAGIEARRRPELRWIFDRPSHEEARADLAAWLAKWQASQPKLCEWVEETIEEALSFLRLPRQHHQQMRSTNVLERLNQEIKRRTSVVRIFPDAASCLRLVRALSAEIHETWMEGGRYLDMELLRERRKADMRKLAA